MKIILSRKGFDSSCGGYPSLIFPNNAMQSLPIPSSTDKVTYSKITSSYKGINLYNIMKNLNPKIKRKTWIELTENITCHLDPDIDRDAIKRDYDCWSGCFGQSQAAQSVLEKHNIGEGDLFLFFGWFKHCYIDENSRLTFEKGEGKHVLFGYMQIDYVLNTKKDTIPNWLSYHPHMIDERASRDNNCIYVAKKTASWNSLVPGFGTFTYSRELDLTKDGYSRSKWQLPEIFKGINISYHNKDSWKEDYFQSACRGQEFVIEENSDIEKWATMLIERNYSHGQI